MEQSFKITFDDSNAGHLRADVLVQSPDGLTTITISCPVEAGAIAQPLAHARAEVLRSAIALMQDQSRTP